MTNKKTGDPLASLREMRTEFSKDESKQEYVVALDEQIVALEKQMEEEKAEFERKVGETVELAATLKGEVDSLKAANEAQKAEFDKLRMEAEARLEAERVATRKAKFESLIADLKNKKKISPPQEEVFKKYAEQPGSATPVAKFTTGEGDEAQEFEATVIDFGTELLLAAPDEMSPKALEEEVTTHNTDSSRDIDRAKTKVTAFETGLRLQRVPSNEIEKLLGEKKAKLVGPDA